MNYFNAALAATKQLVSAGKLSISHFNIHNPSNAVAYLQIFDAAAAADVTVGTTTPVSVIAIKTVDVLDGSPPRGIKCGKGIVIAATTTPTGSTAPSSALVASLECE